MKADSTLLQNILIYQYNYDYFNYSFYYYKTISNYRESIALQFVA